MAFANSLDKCPREDEKPQGKAGEICKPPTAIKVNVGEARQQPGRCMDAALGEWYAARARPQDVVRAVLEHQRDANSQAAVIAAMLNAKLIQHADAKNDALAFMSKMGMVDHVRALLQDPFANPASKSSRALRNAAAHGHTRVVEMLLADGRVDPSAGSEHPHHHANTADQQGAPRSNNNFAIQQASANGHVAVVALLLQQLAVDPAANQNMAIRAAAANGHKEVVELLLRHPRVNPAGPNNMNHAIQSACENGHAGIVRALLNDVRVNPSVDGNYCLREACANGHAEIVYLLLSNPRLDITRSRQAQMVAVYALQDAAGNGHVAVVNLLLADPRFHPGASDNFAIRWASEKGHLEVVKRLMIDARVDPSANCNEALRWALEGGNVDVAKLLHKDPRVRALVNQTVF